jgi:hypothetical protein
VESDDVGDIQVVEVDAIVESEEVGDLVAEKGITY